MSHKLVIIQTPATEVFRIRFGRKMIPTQSFHFQSQIDYLLLVLYACCVQQIKYFQFRAFDLYKHVNVYYNMGYFTSLDKCVQSKTKA